MTAALVMFLQSGMLVNHYSEHHPLLLQLPPLAVDVASVTAPRLPSCSGLPSPPSRATYPGAGLAQDDTAPASMAAGSSIRLWPLNNGGMSYCFLSRALAEQLLMSCPGGGASARRHCVQLADNSLRETGGAATVQLLLCGLDEETALVDFDVDCNGDITLGHD